MPATEAATMDPAVTATAAASMNSDMAEAATEWDPAMAKATEWDLATQASSTAEVATATSFRTMNMEPPIYWARERSYSFYAIHWSSISVFISLPKWAMPFPP